VSFTEEKEARMKKIVAVEVGPYRQPCEVMHYDDEVLREFVKERTGTPCTEKDVQDKSVYLAQGAADYHAPGLYFLPLLVFYGVSLCMLNAGFILSLSRLPSLLITIFFIALLSAFTGRLLKRWFFRRQKYIQENMIRGQMDAPVDIVRKYYQLKITQLTERFAGQKVAAKEGAEIWVDLNGIHVDYCRSLLHELIETLERWSDVEGRPYVLDRAKALADELEMRLRALEAFGAAPVSDREGHDSQAGSLVERLHHAYANLPPLPRIPVAAPASTSSTTWIRPGRCRRDSTMPYASKGPWWPTSRPP
jgi:hypothetical protein